MSVDDHTNGRCGKILGPKLGKQVTFVSISIDPEHDRPAELEKYARARGADEAGWLFLTGTPAQIDRVLTLYHLERTRYPDGTVNHAVASFLSAQTAVRCASTSRWRSRPPPS